MLALGIGVLFLPSSSGGYLGKFCICCEFGFGNSMFFLISSIEFIVLVDDLLLNFHATADDDNKKKGDMYKTVGDKCTKNRGQVQKNVTNPNYSKARRSQMGPWPRGRHKA